MIATTNVFGHVQLAEASYSLFDLSGYTTDEQVIAGLTNAANFKGQFSSSQATALVSFWRIAHHQPDTASGFSATLFVSKQDPNEVVLAVRGTQGIGDLILTDGGDIALDGLALYQIVDLYNYWQYLSAPVGATYAAARVIDFDAARHQLSDALVDLPSGRMLTIERGSSTDFFAGTALALGSGTATSPASITVTGHSLGGHLAAAFTRLFSFSGAEALAVNGAGFVTANPNVDTLFRLLNGAAIFDANHIANIFGDKGPEIVAQDWYLQQAGGHHAAFIEVLLDNSFGHGSSQMTDSLAVYDLFLRMDSQLKTATPDAALSKLKLIFDAANAQAGVSLESLVNALVNLFGLDFTPLTGSLVGDREALYQRLVPLRAIAANLSTSNPGMLVDVLANTAAADLANIAQGSTAFGYRYALRELNPFAVLGNNDLYTLHNTNGELDIYDATNRTGTLTEDWIKDRAGLLQAVLTSNTQDNPDIARIPGAGDVGSEYHYYTDSKERVLFADPIDRAPGQLRTQVVAFADDAGRLLVGSDNLLGDRLYGGTGTDYLQGRANDDSLEGGKGLDIYQYSASNSTNDGADTFRDTDGKGVIRYTFTQSGLFSNTMRSTVIADASVRVSGLQWNSADGKFSYTRSQNDLIVTINGDAGGSITLRDFRDGDFNIHLWEARTDPQINSPEIVGDLQPMDFDPNTDGIQIQTDALGNVIVTTTPEPDRVDVLNDSAGNDRIIAGGGNDILRGIRGGDDWLSGDAGRDNLAGGAGADLVEGGTDGIFENEPGGDIAYGDVGGDELYADAKIALAQAITQGNTGAASNAKGEYLSGGGGDDWIVSAAGNDYLDGGSGQDLIVGGAGDDNITGDYGFVAITPLWVITREIVPEGGVTVHRLNFVSGSVSVDFGLGAADVIYAGSGADWVAAGDGDDFADGGPGENKMWGEAGSDVLIGGADNDLLVGDNPTIITGAAEGADYLDGGAGNDKLEGDGGGDVLIGGTGTDTLSGGTGKDIYVFNKGDGTDTVFDSDTSSNNPDASVLVLGDGVSQSDIKFKTGSLAVDIGPADPADPNSPRDVIHFNGFNQIDPEASTPLAEIQFAGGDSMSYADILTRGFDIDGTEGDDTGVLNVVGTGVNDRIHGFAGNDLLFGLRGDDLLEGGDGVDQLLGGPGADTIYGGSEHDEIWGDAESGGIFAPDGADLVYAGAGDDIVQGNGGDDHLFGEEDGDTLFGDDGADTMEGGLGDDFLYGQGFFFVFGVPELNLFDDRASDVLIGGEGNDYLNSAGGNDVLEGGAGSDTLEGDLDADHLMGGDGNDFLWGDKADSSLADKGNDTLDGGAGNDQLVGYAGNDTYVFGRGYGQDIVFDQDSTVGNIDQVLFAADITPDHISAVQSGANLVLTISATTDTLTIANQFASTADRVEEIRFADGTVWTSGSIPLPIRGTAGNDVLSGTAGPDVFEGLTGNDTMSGGTGNDSYRISRGDGQDVITDSDGTLGNIDRVVYAADILPSDIQVVRSGTNLVLRVSGTTDQVALTNYFLNDGITANSVEQITFLADGTVWDVNTVKQMALVGTANADVITGYATSDVLSGLGGNDTLNGGAGHDTLDGGTGNDLLQGGSGNDVYFIVRGSGQDTITDTDATVGNTDRVVYADDILPSEVQVTRSSTNLVLKLADSTDQVTVTNYFQNDGANTSLVEQIEFLSNGTTWSVDTVKLLALTGAEGNDSITGYATNDVLSGFAGNDTLIGNAGHDTLDGGTGNDLLQGGPGNDFYVISRGSGQDTITDNDATLGNVDRIAYAADILPPEVRATRSFDNLVVKLIGAADQVTVTNYFQNDGATASLVEQITFLADGTTWDRDFIKSLVLIPTDGDDSITGYATADNLSGMGGNDVVRGAGGNDTLSGGAGNDTLSGDAGADTYVFARGDGQDVIDNAAGEGGGTIDVLRFADDILPADVIATREVRDLVLSIQGSTDHVRIRNYFFSGTNVVEEIRFADGTVWNERTILAFLPTPPVIGTEGDDFLFGTLASELIRGLGGNDLIRGLGGNDTFEGGPGEDTIIGGTGGDTYLFNIGDGGPPSFFILGDDVSDAGGYDVLQLGAGIGTSGFDLFDHSDARGRMLVLNPAGTNAGVYIIGYFGTGHIEEIRFEDGTVWTDQTIAPLFPVSGTSGNDNMIGTVIADVMNGLDGNDTINGNAGHDTLDGSAGADLLSGLAGNDRLIGGDGADELSGGDGNDTLEGGLGGDTLHGDAGDDVLNAGTGEAKNAKLSNLLYGGTGNDVLVSSGKADQLYGEEGADILLGAGGIDWLEDGQGNNLMFGGAASDHIHMGDQNDLAIGGTGNDLLGGDSDVDGIRGRDILAFNKSDGADSVNGLGSGSTISIGGGTLYGNLSLEVQGTTLRLKTGSSHYIALTDWYASPANKSVTTLQMVIEGTRDYKPTSTNPMNNNKIQAFDFLGLVEAFDAARAAGRKFSVASNLANFRLWSSDTEAIGGSVAYQYARTGSVSALTYDQMRSVTTAAEFGVSAQPIMAVPAAEAVQTFSVVDSSVPSNVRSLAERASSVIDSASSASTQAAGETPVEADPAEDEAVLQQVVEGNGEAASRIEPVRHPFSARSPLMRSPPQFHAPQSVFPDALASRSTMLSVEKIAPLAVDVAAQPAATERFADDASEMPARAVESASQNGDVRTITSAPADGPSNTDLDILLDGWFADRPWSDLSLLDEIARGGDALGLFSHGDSAALHWRRAHAWLNRHPLDSNGDEGAELRAGTDVFSLSGDSTSGWDAARSPVGLRGVAGHDLKPFAGLREGMHSLAQ